MRGPMERATGLLPSMGSNSGSGSRTPSKAGSVPEKTVATQQPGSRAQGTQRDGARLSALNSPSHR